MLIIKFITGIVLSIIVIVLIVSAITYLVAQDCFSDNTCKTLLKKFIDKFFEESES